MIVTIEAYPRRRVYDTGGTAKPPRMPTRIAFWDVVLVTLAGSAWGLAAGYTAGSVSTYAGICQTSAGYRDGTASTAMFNSPRGVAVDSSGNLFVADSSNHRIRKVAPNGTVSTFAGSGNAAFADGQATSASFNTPAQLVVDSSDNIYVMDSYNHAIRKITPSGTVTTLGASTRPVIISSAAATHRTC